MIDIEKMRPAERKLFIEARKRELAAERAAERRMIRRVGFVFMALSGAVVGLAVYDIANGDFPAVSVFCVGTVGMLYVTGRVRLWMLGRRVLSGKEV